MDKEILTFIIVFISFVFIPMALQKSDTVKSNFRKWSSIFIALGFATLITFAVSISVNELEKVSSGSNKVADGFTIEEFKVNMDVKETGSIDVKEYITVNFYEGGHHGIYRFIPSWLVYTNKDGVSESRESKISKLVAEGETYVVDTVSGKKRIKIGDADYILSPGNYTYEISYTYDMGSDPYENFDEFIFHAFGDYWGTTIKNASVIINMPKEFDYQGKVKFFADKYRSYDITSNVSYGVSGKTLYAYVSSYYPLNSALTIDIELPEGYFVNGRNNYGVVSLSFCVLCIVIAVVSIVLWRKNGKDLDKVPETVEFYPPEKLDAAEIGYLYKPDTGRKLSVALIVELASKGLIKIIESEDKKTTTIVKLKPKTEVKMTANEKIVYDRLFKEEDATTLSENKTFYKAFAEVAESVRKRYDDKINDLVAYKYMVIASFGFLLGTILWGSAYCFIEDMNPKLSSFYTFAFIANMVTLVFAILMKRKNLYGEQIKAKINGFKSYMEVAEKSQLEMLVEENPNYFYDILPYAYVLGVSKKWIKKFENIPVPDNNMGSFDYYSISSIDSLSDSVYVPSSSGSGGGCSSCGGGCSSCGGGGSW